MSARASDLIVIGSGPAGEKGAAQAAYFGKRVALIERMPHLGGASINTGTVCSGSVGCETSGNRVGWTPGEVEFEHARPRITQGA